MTSILSECMQAWQRAKAVVWHRQRFRTKDWLPSKASHGKTGARLPSSPRPVKPDSNAAPGADSGRLKRPRADAGQPQDADVFDG